MKRTLAEFGGREGLWPAELTILDNAAKGHLVNVSPDGAQDYVPSADAPGAVRVRASFIRYLALGGCTASGPCEKGLRVKGAYIEGDNDGDEADTRGLDLEGCSVRGELQLVWCYFPDRVILRHVTANSLTFDKSTFEVGLTVRAARISENLNLRAVDCLDELSLSQAEIGGNLILDGSFVCADKYSETDSADRDQFAIVAQNLVVLGGLLFRETVNLKKALDQGILRARHEPGVSGGIDLRAADFGYISDAEVMWPTGHPLLLNRCEYRALLAGAPLGVRKRLEWLTLRDAATTQHPFWPQPYEQLAKVYRNMGHRIDAKRVLIKKEELQRADRRRRVSAGLSGGSTSRLSGPIGAALARWYGKLQWPGDFALGAITGYGYAPHRALYFLFGFLMAGWWIFQTAGDADAIKPNDAFSLRSPDWVLCATPATETVTLPGGTKPVNGRAAPDQSQYDCFVSNQSALGYPTFNPLVYSLDTLLPVVSLEVQQYWIPDERFPVGWWARIYLWVQIAAGWIFSLFAVAGFSGLIKSD